MKLTLKHTILWIITTFLIYIIAASLIMYSRAQTLDAVKLFEFKIYKKTIEHLNKETVFEDIKSIADQLTFKDKNGTKNFFPIALLNKEKCLENGAGDNNICSKFKNLTIAKEILNNTKKRKRYDQTIYDISDKKSYLVSELLDNHLLIGEAGEYQKKHKSNLWVFISTEWKNYFLRYNKTKAGTDGFKRTWKKTKEIFIVISSVSFILYFLVIYIQLLNKRRFLTLSQKLKIESNKLETLHGQYKESIATKKMLQEELSNQDNQIEIDKLNKSILELKKNIEIVENNETMTNSLLIKQSNNLTSAEKSEELNKMMTKLHNVKQLWLKDFDWNDRKTLESLITGGKINIPFTLTLGFILFENQFIDELAKKSDYYEFATNLATKIELVCKENNINETLKSKLHEIRIARNKWFHYGKKPNEETINDLMSVLKQYNITAHTLI